jgi:superfamily II DNA or RNA helicase
MTTNPRHPELELRPYQHQAISALDAAWAGVRRPSAGPRSHEAVNRPACVLPTGSGKTVIFSRLGARAHAAGGRALFLVHRDELVTQTVAKLKMSAPGAWIGAVKAEQNEVDADLVVASVQTLARESRRAMISQRGLMLGVADEAHHAASPSWMTTMAHFGAYRPMDHPGRVPWAGFTATMAREDRRGLGDVWEEIAFSRSIGQMVADGYLVKPVGRRVQVEDLNLAKVRASRGDLQANDLGDALMDAGAPGAAARAVLEHAKDRHTAAFWPTVATAEAFVDECKALGLTAELIVGTTKTEDRRAAYERFRTGETSVLSTPWCSPRAGTRRGAIAS